MSFAFSISEAVMRLKDRDPTFDQIYLKGQYHTDKDLIELMDLLLTHPNFIGWMSLASNQLTDKTGIKLARYLARSSTLQSLTLRCNQFSKMTYLAIAAALRINTSLRILNLHDNLPMDRRCIDTAFVDALLLNPIRPAGSIWWLYSEGFGDIDYKRLKQKAEELGHPSMQSMLQFKYL